MVKITGFDKLQRQLKEAQNALAAIDGDIGSVSFSPTDPGSIEAAIQQVELMIDERVGTYSGNPIVSPLIEQMKDHYREAIIQKAAAVRLGEPNGE